MFKIDLNNFLKSLAITLSAMVIFLLFLYIMFLLRISAELAAIIFCFLVFVFPCIYIIRDYNTRI